MAMRGFRLGTVAQFLGAMTASAKTPVIEQKAEHFDCCTYRIHHSAIALPESEVS